MNWRYLFILPIFLFVCIAFGENDGRVEMTPEQFVKVYVELSIAAEQFLDDSTSLARIQDSIFVANDVTRGQFDIFREKIDKEPEKWGKVWQDIVKKLEEKDKKSREKLEKTAKPEKPKPEE